MKLFPSARLWTLALLTLFISSTAIQSQTTAFNYQGRLTDSNSAANGTYDLQFALYNALTAGTQISTTQTQTGISVSSGTFTVQLDFGNVFPGANRYLEIRVKKPADANYTVLEERQQLTSSPYSIRTLSAATADTATNATNAVNAQTANSAGNVTGIVAIANGGTGSATQNFVDLATNQTNIGGNKTFTGNVTVQNPTATSTIISGVNSAPAGASTGIGVLGTTNQSGTGSAGVVGRNNNSSGTGIIAAGNNQAPNNLVAGSGLAATGFTTAIYARTNNPGVSQAAYTDNFGSVTRVNYWDGVSQYKIQGAGAVSTIVRDTQKNSRVMFAPEAPEVLLEDYGVGQLVNGRARIDIDPIFAANITVDEKHPLKVFIQLEGDCNGVFVTNKTAAGFEVIELAGGKSNVNFSWHIVGNRANEELGGAQQLDGTVTPKRISRYTDLRFPIQKEDSPALTVPAEANVTKPKNK